MSNDYDQNITLKTAVDLEVVGENILDIADFAIEKHEFRHDLTLSPELREKAAKQIRLALWELIEEFKQRRKQVLRRMFETADRVMKDTVDAS